GLCAPAFCDSSSLTGCSGYRSSQLVCGVIVLAIDGPLCWRNSRMISVPRAFDGGIGRPLLGMSGTHGAGHGNDEAHRREHASHVQPHRTVVAAPEEWQHGHEQEKQANPEKAKSDPDRTGLSVWDGHASSISGAVAIV